METTEWRATAPVLLAPRSVGEALRMLTSRADLTVEALASLTHISRTSLAAYFADERVPSAQKLSLLLGVLAQRLGYEPEGLETEVSRMFNDDRAASEALEGAPGWLTRDLFHALGLVGVKTSWEDCPTCQKHLVVHMSLEDLNARSDFLAEVLRIASTFGLETEVAIEGDEVLRKFHPRHLG